MIGIHTAPMEGSFAPFAVPGIWQVDAVTLQGRHDRRASGSVQGRKDHLRLAILPSAWMNKPTLLFTPFCQGSRAARRTHFSSRGSAARRLSVSGYRRNMAVGDIDVQIIPVEACGSKIRILEARSLRAA